MVAEELRTGLYVTIPLYFLMLATVAFWAYRKNDKMKKEGINDALSAHYLGGRSFGPVVMAGTMFASLFSGYTVVGVPNEAYFTGWFSLRWTVGGISLMFGLMGTGMRLRKVSLVRNHQSPADFMTDRYQCQVLRYTIVFLQVIPSVIYLAAQVIAIKGSVNSMFGLDPNAVYPVIIIMVVILLFEWAGGLSSVALTDAIQGFVMMLSFIMLPSIIKRNFGGWSDLDLSTYPRPDFYQNPSSDAQWLFWQFTVSLFGFFTLPHFVQRTYAARNMKALKVSYMLLSVSVWFTLFVGCFIGTVGVQMLADEPTPSNPFAAILEQIMLLGGFPEAVGVIAFTASLAAIMSTADSLIIAISQLITSDVVYPIKPDATPVQITWIGRFVSFCTTVIAVVIGLFWNEGISALGAVQFGISIQAIPPFLLGLFATSPKWDCHPWNLASGAWVGTIVVFAVYFGYVDVVSNPRPINSGVLGLGCQLVTTLLLEIGRRIMVGFKNRSAEGSPDEQAAEDVEKSVSGIDKQETSAFSQRPAWDFPKMQRFGERPLTPAFLYELMKGIKEPITNIWACSFFFLMLSIMTPLVPENQPPFDENGEFVSPPATYNGLPWWAFKIMLLGVIPTVAFVVMAYQLPNTFYPDDDTILDGAEDIDPDAVLMTTPEMGRRNSYDERNTMVRRRRSSIQEQMENMHLIKSEPPPVPDASSRRRLSDLVQGNIPIDEIDEDEDGSNEPDSVENPAKAVEVADKQDDNVAAVEVGVELDN